MQFKQILHFSPFLKSVIWGGSAIARMKGICGAESNIGESWELSPIEGYESCIDNGNLKGLTLKEVLEENGRDLLGDKAYALYGTRFPLMVKIIDAGDRLSLQVHPPKSPGIDNGKDEFWYILESCQDSTIYMGLKEEIEKEEITRLSDSKFIEAKVRKFSSAPHDTFFIPGGVIHGLGAGNLILEIQDASDTTYRIFDYDREDKNGNKRELHLDKAREVMTFGPSRESKALCRRIDGETLCHSSTYNVAYRNGDVDDDAFARDRFTVVAIISGNIESDGICYAKGDTLLIPANRDLLSLSGRAEYLCVTPNLY